MLRILWNSRSGMSAEQDKLDNISNNIANVNTEGYKKTNVSFSDLVYENLNRTGYPNSRESINGTGVRTGPWSRDNTQGSLSQTDAKTDLAIDGQGYFRIQLPDKNADGTYKTAYTRAGSFNVDGEGNIVDKNGNKLIIDFNTNSELDNHFTKDSFKVNEDGTVYNTVNGEEKAVGKISLYNVVSGDSLISIGNNLYAVATKNINGVDVPVEKPYLVNDTTIRQGFLELSNVDLGKEMTDMIVAQRAFELNSKAMSTADQMWSMTNNLSSK
ncbi:flagellar hook-basal body complex protein [Candidatus Clostridium radicumherbarum]|uniref:Flagellar hook-basal body complex protein n=1 Tax=Candidatus Clostridium radicumherbarum TaxID=3381662 RepID=A0ABW8TVX0_9CLOT